MQHIYTGARGGYVHVHVYVCVLHVTLVSAYVGYYIQSLHFRMRRVLKSSKAKIRQQLYVHRKLKQLIEE